jgi:metal-responsive CopG/Arc/MetJ family transcriptional regulator
VKVETSVLLPEELLAEIDKADSDRSGFLEKAARDYLARAERAKRRARDAALYEAHAERLNQEALDALEFQSLPD